MELFLHIGLHKTGTTFMQRAVFRHWKGIQYVGRPYRDDPLVALTEPETQAVLVSNESLAGGLRSVYTGDETWSERQHRHIARLGEVFPNAHPLISFRRHDAFLLSLYKHYLKYGGTRRLEEFFDPQSDSGVLKHDDILQFNRLRWTREAFQHEPFVFFCEELGEGLHALVAELAEVFGTEAPELGSKVGKRYNEGVNAAQAQRLLATNRLLAGAFQGRVARRVVRSAHSIAYRFAAAASMPLQLTDEQRSFIVERYRDDWRALVQYAVDTRSHDPVPRRYEV